jgi:hypothetical protein
VLRHPRPERQRGASGRDAVRATAGAELAQREALAYAVADRATVHLREGVRSRKLAIARGQGDVHGRHVVLATWGPTDLPAVVA